MTPNPDHDEFNRAFEAAFARLQFDVERACRRGREWPERVAAGMLAALTFAAADPQAARTLTSDALAQGRSGYERYEHMVEQMSKCLAKGRSTSFEADMLPETTEKALVGGVLMLVAQRLEDGREYDLAAVARETTQLVLTPYLGIEEARECARRFDQGAG